MGANAGYLGKVALGSNVVANINTYEISGQKRDMREVSVFLDTWKKYAYGQGDGGQVKFEGFFDAADTNGQNAIRTAWINGTTLATGTTNDPRLYFSSTEYLELSSGAECLVEELSVGKADLSGTIPVSFTLRVSGGYFKVHT